MLQTFYTAAVMQLQMGNMNTSYIFDDSARDSMPPWVVAPTLWLCSSNEMKNLRCILASLHDTIKNYAFIQVQLQCMFRDIDGLSTHYRSNCWVDITWVKE